MRQYPQIVARYYTNIIVMVGSHRVKPLIAISEEGKIMTTERNKA